MKYVLYPPLEKCISKITWKVQIDFQVLKLLSVPHPSLVAQGKHDPNAKPRFPALLFTFLAPFCASSYAHLLYP